MSLSVFGIYRPGSQTVTSTFFDELSSVLEQICLHTCPFVICSDLNIHVNELSDSCSMRLAELLQSFDCTQHVNEPTHKDGHILDLVITRRETTVSAVHVGGLLSDHALVTATLDISKPPVQYTWTTCRNWRNLSLTEFETDLTASRLCNDLSSLDEMSADELTDLYKEEMTSLLDKHCPVTKVRHRLGEMTPWFDSDCRASRRRSRQLERRYRRTRSSADKLAWDDQLKEMRLLYKDKHQNYWKGKIIDNKGDCQKLWRTLSGVMGEKTSRYVDAEAHSAEEFAKFFDEKVKGVRESTSSTPLYDVPVTACSDAGHVESCDS